MNIQGRINTLFPKATQGVHGHGYRFIAQDDQEAELSTATRVGFHRQPVAEKPECCQLRMRSASAGFEVSFLAEKVQHPAARSLKGAW